MAIVVAVVKSRVCQMRRRLRIGNDRRWRGMKSVWRKTVLSKYKIEIFGRQAGHYGLTVGRERG